MILATDLKNYGFLVAVLAIILQSLKLPVFTENIIPRWIIVFLFILGTCVAFVLVLSSAYIEYRSRIAAIKRNECINSIAKKHAIGIFPAPPAAAQLMQLLPPPYTFLGPWVDVERLMETLGKFNREPPRANLKDALDVNASFGGYKAAGGRRNSR